MSEISGVSGPSALPPSEPTQAQSLQKLAKEFNSDIEVLVAQLNQMTPESAKDPAEIKKFQTTINNLHTDAMKATGGHCSGC